jgi:hypothetical protein
MLVHCNNVSSIIERHAEQSSSYSDNRWAHPCTCELIKDIGNGRDTHVCVHVCTRNPRDA